MSDPVQASAAVPSYPELKIIEHVCRLHCTCCLQHYYAHTSCASAHNHATVQNRWWTLSSAQRTRIG